MKTASASVLQAADTRHEKLTLWTGTATTTPRSGARRGLTLPTVFWSRVTARNASTTAAMNGRACLGIKSCKSLHAFGMRAFCVLPEVETEHESAISARFHKNQATNVRKYFLTTPRAGIVTCYDMPRAKERGIGIGLRFGRTAQRTD